MFVVVKHCSEKLAEISWLCWNIFCPMRKIYIFFCVKMLVVAFVYCYQYSIYIYFYFFISWSSIITLPNITLCSSSHLFKGHHTREALNAAAHSQFFFFSYVENDFSPNLFSGRCPGSSLKGFTMMQDKNDGINKDIYPVQGIRPAVRRVLSWFIFPLFSLSATLFSLTSWLRGVTVYRPVCLILFWQQLYTN